MRRFILVFALSVGLSAHAVPAEGHQLMIAAPSQYAVEAGRKVAEKGGNVIDVAVTVGLTLSVTTPYYAALGGGGFALTKMTGVVEALDFRETAPAATGKEYFAKLAKEASVTGGSAVGVPGFAAGLLALHQKYGRLKWASLFEDPIRLASEGFAVSGEWSRQTAEEAKRFNKGGLATFFHADGSAYKPGEKLKQPGLAKALTALRDQKAKGFYEGPIAQDLAAAVKAAGGTMTALDLKNYKVRWLAPLVTTYEGNTVYLMPPPSSGGVVLFSALKLIEKLDLKSKPALSVDEYHLLAEIEARAFRGRVLLGDPDFHKNPITFLTSDTYLDTLTKTVDPKKSVAMVPLKFEDHVKESSQTTHFSVMDAQGHAIALTVTLNGNYGSAVVSSKYGIALNDEMDDFTTRPGQPNMFGLIQGDGNLVEPGKRPLSSMSPTLVEKDGKLIMAIGAPGGPRIITAVLQGLYRILGRGTNVDLAVQLPRVHHQFLPNVVYVDRGRFSPEVLDGLKARGHQVQESGGMGKLYVVHQREDGLLDAAFDSRGEGAAGGI